MSETTTHRVLIVEDSATMRQLLVISARRAGAEVFEAADGLQALKLLTQHRFDVIFIDVNMPVMDGFKLIRRVREDPQHGNVPICVCTTEDDAETQARKLGATYFLRKPTRRQEVEAVLAAALQTA